MYCFLATDSPIDAANIVKKTPLLCTAPGSVVTALPEAVSVPIS